MRTFSCVCGNPLFFLNTLCLSCGRGVGWCPACQNVTSLAEEAPGRYRCTVPGCGAALVKCPNYEIQQVCNWCSLAPSEPGAPAPLCDSCRFNETIPDLSIPGNRQKWARIEAAKRRMLYMLNLLGLPYGTAADGFDPPLSFDFKADAIPVDGVWQSMGEEERVYTGHAGGKITINIREADDAERERLRVDFGEAHRTLISHFRHEIGHYYWAVLIQGRREHCFKAAFGDYENPPYGEALERYYREGPPPDWQSRYVSAYAAMHPWEDWAETFGFYLDMAGVLDTAASTGLTQPVPWDDPGVWIDRYCSLGVVMNEMNRSMGLLDLAPETLTSTAVQKLALVHSVVREAGASAGRLFGGASSERRARQLLETVQRPA